MKFYEKVISDFGGYEKCKDILSQPNIGLIMNAQGLREHMLEYRRQHNIFEVGDKVVFIDKYSNNILLTIAELTCSYAFTSEEFGEINFDAVRHATDAEIKAGKRLEVNDGN